jgi:hypothetical protein
VGEVRAEGQRPNVVIAAVDFRRDASGESFGVAAVTAGRMPDSAFPAGDRVESL